MRAAGLLFAVAHAACAQAALPVAGDWWTPGFSARVRLEPCGSAVCGRIVWLWDEAPRHIADERPLLGRVVVAGMLPRGDGRWTDGTLYNPEDGREYRGFFELQSPTRLVVEGCVLFVCKSQVWRRADAVRCPPVATER